MDMDTDTQIIDATGRFYNPNPLSLEVLQRFFISWMIVLCSVYLSLQLPRTAVELAAASEFCPSTGYGTSGECDQQPVSQDALEAL